MINVVSNRKKRQLMNRHFDAFSMKLLSTNCHCIRNTSSNKKKHLHYLYWGTLWNFYSSKTKKVRMIVHKQNMIRKKRKWIVLFIFLYTNYQLCNIWFNCQSNLIKRIIELKAFIVKFESYISKCLTTSGLLFYLYPLLL